MLGFASQSLTMSRPAVPSLPKCGACGLHKQCRSPKMPVTGDGQRGILVVAEAPCADEDYQNTQLVGDAGQVMRRALNNIGVDLDADCWKTNAIICRPPGNRTPTDKEIDYCRPNLFNTIKQLKPRHIITLGQIAVKSLIGPLWREEVGSMVQWAGWHIPFQEWNCWITPNYHPSYVMRAGGDLEGPVVKVWFERYLASALTLQGHPWDVVPDYTKEVQPIYDPTAAAAWIRDKMALGGAFAFDYETDRLKPDHPDAQIVCCSLCWRGRETIAFPWTGEAIVAMREFLESGHPKIGANNKFEWRWTQRLLGAEVKNFVWDTVLQAHQLDNRDGITSVKFQAFVRLGFQPWNFHIHPFLTADTGNGRNRIREVDMRSLLEYCAIDSLVEYKLAVIQKKEMQQIQYRYAV